MTSSAGTKAGRKVAGILTVSPQSLAAAELVCTGSIVAYDLFGQTSATQTDVSKPSAKLPRPGPIVASLGFYSILAFAAAASTAIAPILVASGWVLALAVLVTGNRGKGVVNLLAGLARQTQKLS